MNTKHSAPGQQNPCPEKPKIHPLELRSAIRRAAQKLANDECFPDDLQCIYNRFDISLEECIELNKVLSPIFTKFDGNAEKYFTNFYQLLLPSAKVCFAGLNNYETNLLLTEVANICLAHLSWNSKIGQRSAEAVCNSEKVFTKREIDALQYLSGYCFWKIFCKISGSSKAKTDFGMQSLCILKSAKTDETQTFIDMKNRGGLWKVNQYAVNVFKQVEIHFCKRLHNSLQHIDANNLVTECLRDTTLKANMSCIIAKADLELDKEVATNIFESLIHLFIRVRSHSFAKDIKEKHKRRKSLSKKRSLRTEMKQTSSPRTPVTKTCWLIEGIYDFL